MIDANVIAQLKAENPTVEIHKVGSKGTDIVVRAPTPAEYQRFVQLAAEPKTKYAAMTGLVRSCTLFPKGPELEKLLTAKPGIVLTFTNKLAEIAGVEEEAESEKL